MAAALKKAGKSVEVHLETWGVHGLPDPEKRHEYYRSIAEFLARNLPRD
jgi:dipeptidyl aminopeptidase/acylaminoacyl peptidase